MNKQEFLGDFFLSQTFDYERIVAVIADLLEIDRLNITNNWENWDDPQVVCELMAAAGEFPQRLIITLIDENLRVNPPDELKFAGKLSTILNCSLFGDVVPQELFGFSNSDPYVSVLVSGMGQYQMIRFWGVEVDNEELSHGVKIEQYHQKFTSLADAPIVQLQTKLNAYEFRYFASVDSTNDIAQEWLREGAEQYSVVIADEQRKGRGRRGRTWYTPPNVALAVSIILKPSPDNASQLSMVGALAVYDLCQQVGITDIGIKWPNDVQVKGKKISGILPEAVWEGDNLLGVILGMGVNVRNQFEGELLEIATSIEAELGESVDRVELIASLLERVEFWAKKLGTDDLLQSWKSRLTTLGQSVRVDGVNQYIVGQAVDVETNGALLIKTEDGSIQTVMAGDVSLRPQDEG